MPIKINFNICDNSPECSGIVVCDYGAISWDEELLNVLGEKGSLRVDNSRCISCGKCVGSEGCPVGAIIFAKTDNELAELTKDTDIDSSQIKSLFVERYGAEPIDEGICVNIDEIQELLSISTGIILVEEFADWSIECLLSSIPVESIIQKMKVISKSKNIRYYKCDCTDVKNEGEACPVLKIYNGNALVGQIDGYYDNTQFDKMVVAIERILG